MLISALLILLRYTLNFLPLSEISHFSTSTRVKFSRSDSFLYTELNGILHFSEISEAVLPFLIIENKIALDSASANASITFCVISYFFNCGNVNLRFKYVLSIAELFKPAILILDY